MAQLIDKLGGFPDRFRGCAMAIGNFDGVHRGHVALVSELVRQARELQSPAVVMTFFPPPVYVLFPERTYTAPLTALPRRAELLGALGVDAVLAYPTDKQLLNLSAADFFQQILIERLNIVAIVEGPNFRFGKDRQGDTRLLSQMCADAQIAATIVDAQHDTGEMISSSRIRTLLESGEIMQANRMLTEPYQIRGRVSRGEQRGRELGFPTANLEDVDSLLPKQGVYAGAVRLDGRDYAAAVNIGHNPTFGDDKAKFEIHIIGWEGALYGQTLHCSLLDHLRDTVRFHGADELRAQLQRDIDGCKSAFQRLYPSAATSE